MMSLIIALSVVCGVLFGRFLLTTEQVSTLSGLSSWALALVLFTIGYDLATDRNSWQRFRQLGWRVFLVPAAIVAGSLTGALFAGLLVDLGAAEALSVGAGFGWYSLSGVLLSNLGYPSLGAIAFLSNVFRELIAVLAIPALSKHLGPLAAIAPGGATTMDTTLPLLSRFGTHESTLVAFISGAVLSMLVPLLVPLFAGLIN